MDRSLQVVTADPGPSRWAGRPDALGMLSPDSVANLTAPVLVVHELPLEARHIKPR